MSETSIKVDWQPLPPRRRKGGKKEVSSSEDDVQVGSKRKQVAEHQHILDNISQRVNVVRMETTLEGNDGCAGEFYECKFV